MAEVIILRYHITCRVATCWIVRLHYMLHLSLLCRRTLDRHASWTAIWRYQEWPHDTTHACSLCLPVTCRTSRRVDMVCGSVRSFRSSREKDIMQATNSCTRAIRARRRVFGKDDTVAAMTTQAMCHNELQKYLTEHMMFVPSTGFGDLLVCSPHVPCSPARRRSSAGKMGFVIRVARFPHPCSSGDAARSCWSRFVFAPDVCQEFRKAHVSLTAHQSLVRAPSS